MTTIRDDAILEPGDLVLVELGPVRGSEQDGRRPALVVSVQNVHLLTRRALICPITSNIDPWPSKVLLPPGLAAKGAVLTDQLRAIDRKERILRRLGSVPAHVLSEAKDQIAILLDLRND
ncbi:type II toxin-antitoxin system PemK/MazF family toxin [Methylobacterium iners]|uniref:Endoribonuclease toxin MazF n=1 Tax=Methylobacterium iners TaxID=418707 RepID=A0ABQ4RXE4_9HYPH|nr:type II toxin-antitoxin system PemK/MazF family toxin [Methylobacterium iners]GJD95510.1 Endoribonuclease toxin MazF [Methylobacterium iners]